MLDDRPSIPRGARMDMTPTQYDLARWLFQTVEARCGVLSDRDEIVSPMYECLAFVRPIPTENKKATP